MARVMVCDDDEVTATRLVAALRVAGHEAETCGHTMDVLRGAADGQFDLVVIGLDMAGFGRTGALDAMRELAPHVALIASIEIPRRSSLPPRSRCCCCCPPVSARAFICCLQRA